MKRVLILIAGLAFSTAALAQSDRDGRWEFGLLVNNQSSESLGGENGSSVDIDSSTGYGLSLGYNFNSRLALSGEFSWNSPDYSATLVEDIGGNAGVPIQINHTLDVYGINIKGTFNLLQGPITPYVEAGFGWMEIDSNVADQPPITGCWWDPWWGYICNTYYSTYSKTQQSYGAAAGVRWDMNNGMSLKGSYGLQEIDTGSSTDDISLEVFRLELLWRF